MAKHTKNSDQDQRVSMNNKLGKRGKNPKAKYVKDLFKNPIDNTKKK